MREWSVLFCGVNGRSRGSGECVAVSEEVIEVVKSSRSRAKFSIPLVRDLRLFWLLEGGRVVGRRYPFFEFESSAKNTNNFCNFKTHILTLHNSIIFYLLLNYVIIRYYSI